MKTNSLTVILALLLLCFSPFGQLSNGGEVVEVSDGRTIVVATRNGRVKVELQFIEVPKAGHRLHETVKGHLQRMLIGKVVEFKPRVILSDGVIARVLLNNVDVSQQMLRDGAATHVAMELTGQDKNEFEAYAVLEAAAKVEKRGVWSGVNVEPTTAENANANSPRPVLAAVNRRGSSSSGPILFDRAASLESWIAGSPVDGKKRAGLTNHSSEGYSLISIPSVALQFAAEGSNQTVECRAVYAAARPRGRDDGMFALGCRASSKTNDPFSKGGRMSVVAERYVVPLAAFEVASNSEGIRYYRITKAFLSRIANTRAVEIQIDGVKANLTEEAKEFIKQLLSAAEKAT
jgi:endonuclease YncB( thermonuclease family)